MHSTLAKRIGELVDFGWEPQTTLEQLCGMMVDADRKRVAHARSR